MDKKMSLQDWCMQNEATYLLEEWSYEDNKNIFPQIITYGSGKKIYWKCKKDHLFVASVNNRIKGKGCPYCSGRKPIVGKTDLATVNPILVDEWDYEKNVDVAPNELTAHSNKKVYWKCNNGHFWISLPNDRMRGRGCPYCANQKVWNGYNDFESQCQKIAEDWDYEKNGDLKPNEVVFTSHKKISWKCKFCKGEWVNSIDNRVRNNEGCPYCSHRKLLPGYNDIKTEMPSLLLEWNYEKNIGIDPSNVVCGGSKRYWWKCPKCGNEWKSKIGNKIRHGCPSCQSKKHSSYPEYVIYYYLTKIDKTVIHSHQDFGFELDIYIPSKRIGIEYDGSFYHQNKEAKEREKNRKCVEKGITLYRFRENLPELEDTSIDILCTLSNFDTLLSDLIRQIYGDEIDVNSSRDEIYINQLMSYWEEEHSLLKVRPDLALEWDYEKNGVIRPEYVMCNSNKKVGWICANNHHFQTKISERIRGSGCPYCSNRKLLIGFNDLVSQNEKLLKEWDYEKNIGIDPATVIYGGDKQYWWKCSKCGNEWKTSISHRKAGQSCRKCAMKNVNLGRMKRVLNLDTGKEYYSINEAAIECNLKSASICRCCNGKQQTAGGFHWTYC